METVDNIFKNSSNRIFSVRLMWSIGQPFVCGKLEEVVKYALEPNNGIEAFYEIEQSSMKFRKLSKKELKELLSYGLKELSIELFKRY